jgi:hypothetical protein
VFVITVDLSKPGSALHNLQYWINIVREASTKLFQKLQTSNPELASHVEKLVNEKVEIQKKNFDYGMASIRAANLSAQSLWQKSFFR